MPTVNFLWSQVFVKWRAYLFKKSHTQSQPNEISTTNSAVVKKTGLASILALMVGSVHLYGIFILKDGSKTVTYFLVKVKIWLFHCIYRSSLIQQYYCVIIDRSGLIRTILEWRHRRTVTIILIIHSMKL